MTGTVSPTRNGKESIFHPSLDKTNLALPSSLHSASGLLRTLCMTNLVSWILRDQVRGHIPWINGMNIQISGKIHYYYKFIKRHWSNCLVSMGLHSMMQFPRKLTPLGDLIKLNSFFFFFKLNSWICTGEAQILVSALLIKCMYYVTQVELLTSISSHWHWLLITQGISGTRALPGEKLRLGNTLCGEDFPNPYILLKEEVGLCKSFFKNYGPISFMNANRKILNRMIANKI